MGLWRAGQHRDHRRRLRTLSLCLCVLRATTEAVAPGVQPEGENAERDLQMATSNGPLPTCVPHSQLPSKPEFFVTDSDNLHVIKKALRNGHGAFVVGADDGQRSALATTAIHELLEQHQLPGRVFWLKVGQQPLDRLVHELSAQVCLEVTAPARSDDTQLRRLGQALTQHRDLVVLDGLRPRPDGPRGLTPLLCGLQGVQLLALGPELPDLSCAPPWTTVTQVPPSVDRCTETLAEIAQPATAAPPRSWNRLCQRLQGQDRLSSLQLAVRQLASGKRTPGQLLSQLENTAPSRDSVSADSAAPVQSNALAPLFTLTQRDLSVRQRTLLFSTGLLPPDSPLQEGFLAQAVGYARPADLQHDLRALAAQGLLRWDGALRRYVQDPAIRREAAIRLEKSRQGDALLWRALSNILSEQAALPEDPALQASALRFLARRYQQSENRRNGGGPLLAWARRMAEHPGYPMGLADSDRALGLAYGAAVQRRDAWGALAIASAVGRLLHHQGRTGEALEWYIRGLSHARRLSNPRIEGELLERLGQTYHQHGQLDRAIDHLAQAYHAAQRTGHLADQARLLSLLASAYLDQGESRMAVANFEQSLLLLQPLGNRRQQASDLGQLGVAYRDLGHVYTAIDYHERALKLAQQLRDPELEATQLENLGTSHRALGALSESNRHRQRALQLVRTLGDREAEGRLLTLLGATYLEQGDVWQAIACYEEALAIARRREDRVSQGTLLGSLALATRQAGDLKRASDYYEQALSGARSLGDSYGEGQYLVALGQLRLQQNQTEQAVKELRRAVQLASEAGDLEATCQRHIVLGDAELARGDRAAARAHYEAADRLLQSLPDALARRLGRDLAQRLRPATASTTAQGAIAREPTVLQ